MNPLLVVSLLAMTTPESVAPCPTGVVNQIAGLYRWHIQPVEDRVKTYQTFTSQRQRFTPSLFELLYRARRLEPMRDGVFIDFDVFSNTQSETFGAKVTGCLPAEAMIIQAHVDVDVGLRGISSGVPNRLIYEMNRSAQGNWHINNIIYPGRKPVQLRAYLQHLLNSKFWSLPSSVARKSFNNYLTRHLYSNIYTANLI